MIFFLFVFSIDLTNVFVSGDKFNINTPIVILRFIAIDVSNATYIHYLDIKINNINIIKFLKVIHEYEQKAGYLDTKLRKLNK